MALASASGVLPVLRAAAPSSKQLAAIDVRIAAHSWLEAAHHLACHGAAYSTTSEAAGRDLASDCIKLRGMRFYGRHGVLPEETKLGQPFVVNATLFCDLRKAGRSDALGDTINYAEAYKTIQAVVEGQPRQLLEQVAHEACATLLAAHPLLQQVQLSIDKVFVPGVPAVLESVGVQVLRCRADLAR